MLPILSRYCIYIFYNSVYNYFGVYVNVNGVIRLIILFRIQSHTSFR
jgi:hypothetical protein